MVGGTTGLPSIAGGSGIIISAHMRWGGDRPVQTDLGGIVADVWDLGSLLYAPILF